MTTPASGRALKVDGACGADTLIQRVQPGAFSMNTPSPHPVRSWARDLDPQARQQLDNVAKLPIIHSHVAAMADAHLGMGSTVGSVLATEIGRASCRERGEATGG